MAEIIDMYPHRLDPTSLFSEQFFEIARTATLSDEDKAYSDELDRIYAESRQSLEAVLTSEQSALLKELETLSELNLRYAAAIGFLFGIRAPRPTAEEDELTSMDLFSESVVKNFLTIPGMFRFPVFHDRRTRINEIDTILCDSLDDISADRFTDLTAISLQREFAAATRMFETGRQYTP